MTAADGTNSAPGHAEFERTVLPHLDAAYNLARWLLKDPTMAQDVVQDAAVRALTYFPTFRGGDARAWLLQIVRNAAYSTMASRRTPLLSTHTVSIDTAADSGPGLDIPDPGDSPETAYARREERGQLDRALMQLAPELRECLVLRELEELSYKEIVRVTGVPIGTVMSRLWRARHALSRLGAGSRS